MKILIFFNNKGGVGKTSLVYHLSFIFAEFGKKTLAVDLDPQANLTTMFLNEERLLTIWNFEEAQDFQNLETTIFHVVQPILEGTGDIQIQKPYDIEENLYLLAGDLRLSLFEDKLSDAWPKCLMRDQAAVRTMTAFYRNIKYVSEEREIDLVLVDVGPNLGAINRAAILSSDYIILPLAPDLFSLQGLQNLGPTIEERKRNWKTILSSSKGMKFPLPEGRCAPIGYIVLQHVIKSSYPVKAYQRWIDKIPEVFQTKVLQQNFNPNLDFKLSQLKHFRSLMLLAMEARKPMFRLKPADGAIGAHVKAVTDCHEDFKELEKKILEKI